MRKAGRCIRRVSAPSCTGGERSHRQAAARKPSMAVSEAAATLDRAAHDTRAREEKSAGERAANEAAPSQQVNVLAGYVTRPLAAVSPSCEPLFWSDELVSKEGSPMTTHDDDEFPERTEANPDRTVLEIEPVRKIGSRRDTWLGVDVLRMGNGEKLVRLRTTALLIDQAISVRLGRGGVVMALTALAAAAERAFGMKVRMHIDDAPNAAAGETRASEAPRGRVAP